MSRISKGARERATTRYTGHIVNERSITVTLARGCPKYMRKHFRATLGTDKHCRARYDNDRRQT